VLQIKCVRSGYQIHTTNKKNETKLEYKQEMSLKKINGIGFKKGKKYLYINLTEMTEKLLNDYCQGSVDSYFGESN